MRGPGTDRHGSSLLDPDGEYAAPGMRAVEKMAVEVLAHLKDPEVSRTRDVIQIELGGEKGIVLLVTREALELRLPTIEWPGPHDPVDASKLWRRVQWDDIDPDECEDLINAAMKAREQEFIECKYCGEEFPLERRYSDDVCHGCAERHEGVVF